jgi:hypothetical protein
MLKGLLRSCRFTAPVLVALGMSARLGAGVAQDLPSAMKKEGVTDADIDIMMRKNPAKLLGLTA